MFVMKKVEDLVTEQTKMERQSHMDLSEPCVERGGNSTNHKGVLAQYLDTNIPYGIKYPLCHGCHNGKCSNPKHLYWGTQKENVEDTIENGNHGAFKLKGIPKGPKPLEERKRISESLKGRPSNNPSGKNQYSKDSTVRKPLVWDVELLLERKSENLSNVQIGKMLGVTEATIRKRLKWIEKNKSPVV